ncbi:NAD-dependent protein deacylase [Ruminococcaceae bacterium OttesenSCG-928-D13]|nr:NAD-dependent protein deacylase [Ruminococcaceae bacterium OttesenSCG-928-D13]
MDETIQTLQRIIDESERIVFFGGAGVSTESGIPDFRSVDGLYSQRYKYPPEQMLSRSFYDSHPEEFFEFYRDKVICLEARPNAAHQKLAELEAAGRLTAVITQNIDGLHTAAGSKNVIELHGSVHRNFCQSCGAAYSAEIVLDNPGPPVCTACGGRVKPDVVLYEEGLDTGAITRAVKAISEADALIIGGTSLVVYPAAGLVDHYTGQRLVVINKQPTHKDAAADLLIAAPIGETLTKIRVQLGLAPG